MFSTPSTGALTVRHALPTGDGWLYLDRNLLVVDAELDDVETAWVQAVASELTLYAAPCRLLESMPGLAGTVLEVATIQAAMKVVDAGKLAAALRVTGSLLEAAGELGVPYVAALARLRYQDAEASEALMDAPPPTAFLPEGSVRTFTLHTVRAGDWQGELMDTAGVVAA